MQKNGLLILRFPNLSMFPELSHGIFARIGGNSKPPYAGLNIGFNTGDDPAVVRQNRELISGCFSIGEMAFVKQMHGDNVIIYDGRQVMPGKAPLEGDAIATDLADVLLTIQVADCQAVLLYDPVKKAMANIHVGWRGSISNILGKSVIALTKGYGCRPRDIIAGIGPSLGPCCGEFSHYKREIPPVYWPYKDARDHFDFWAVSRDQLFDAGVAKSSIHISGICTKCNTDRFYSYRGEGKTGRFAAVIGRNLG